ncbi:unnamed protein product, partial [Pylaiella littoralis]
EEPFKLPDVVFCPSAGDGCCVKDGSDCLPMEWFISALEVSTRRVQKLVHLDQMRFLRLRPRRLCCQLYASTWKPQRTSGARSYPCRSAPLTTMASSLEMYAHYTLPSM